MTDPLGFVGRRVLFMGVVVGAALSAALVLALLGFRWWWCSILGLGVVIVLRGLGKDGRRLDPASWVRGFDGEQQTSRILAGLKVDGYHVHEHIDIGWGDVDHVIIGPTGVFAIETKNWSGRVTGSEGKLLRNGYPANDSIRQAVRGAIAIKELLDLRWVEAILVCPEAEVVDEPLRVGKVTVVSGTRLSQVILNRTTRFSRAQVERTFADLIAAS
jgi:hypothetical protein